jgi:hypothetical protein
LKPAVSTAGILRMRRLCLSSIQNITFNLFDFDVMF